MWARVMEIAIAMWLGLSPFIFRDSVDPTTEWVCYALAFAIGTLAVICYWRPARRAHLGILLIAIGMALWGRFYQPPPGPAQQNLIAVGFILMMFAIIPTDCLRPPDVWVEDRTRDAAGPPSD